MDEMNDQHSMNRTLTMECCSLKGLWMSTEMECKLFSLDQIRKTIDSDASGQFEIS